ncbi:LytTR family DNA-binding domain-containing protein [Mucilaginibacter gossypii]|uniref:LytR/AlgR family response regulator transcription factor n=1 Tax=Mucilaginibacter gossypii TaxID=551996 RepID=UPI000DCC1436|nr:MULTISPECIES: LytTR family DNA-binding domain-containing protein [Mucilaginibacter]QTE39818.1 LytTR family DNA-binding domain-containing protein [Mucilaginibacter gossypii]RAV54195.1 DNA-binding response regulator [Mucilaginibacter rubeus]
MKLNCLIIDDEPIARKLLQEYIEETDFLVLVGTAENPLKAAGLVNQLEVDLIFLDINMPKMNGLDFLRSSVNLPMVIMTTAYGQYALDGFEMAVVDYLVKPFSLERFLKATQKALELKSLKQKKTSYTDAKPDHFFVKCEGKIEKILYAELNYIEAMANYLTLYTNGGKFVVYLTIKGILEKLPADKFMQVHKSHIVNLNNVQTIEGNMLRLGGVKITIGLNFHDAVMQRLLRDKFIKR